jgi:hypothetical protein
MSSYIDFLNVLHVSLIKYHCVTNIDAYTDLLKLLLFMSLSMMQKQHVINIDAHTGLIKFLSLVQICLIKYPTIILIRIAGFIVFYRFLV